MTPYHPLMIPLAMCIGYAVARLQDNNRPWAALTVTLLGLAAWAVVFTMFT